MADEDRTKSNFKFGPDGGINADPTDAPLIVDETILTGVVRQRDPKADEEFDRYMAEWHVTMLPMSHPIYACRKGGWKTPVEFGPEFKTQKAADEWVEKKLKPLTPDEHAGWIQNPEWDKATYAFLPRSEPIKVGPPPKNYGKTT